MITFFHRIRWNHIWGHLSKCGLIPLIFHEYILCIFVNVLYQSILLSKNQKPEIFCFKERNKKDGNYSFSGRQFWCVFPNDSIFMAKFRITIWLWRKSKVYVLFAMTEESLLSLLRHQSVAWHILPLLASVLWTVKLDCESIKQVQKMKNFSLLTLDFKTVMLICTFN